MPINVPTAHNPKLQAVVNRVNEDVELHQLWRCANVNAVDRSGINDHGEVHVRIVANASLKMLRLLYEAAIEPSIVANYGLTRDDAEVIVVVASCLHDLGIAIHRDDHERLSLILAQPKVKELLTGIYSVEETTILACETLHAILAHHWEIPCLTIEAGVTKVGDALDMAKGRSRIPFEGGSVSIHAVSAAAIDNVEIKKGEVKPIAIEILMSNSAGIFQIDQLLKRKLRGSSIASYVEVQARIEGEVERRLLTYYSF